MSLASLRNWRAQWFPPSPTFTEQHLQPQNGRVFIVTGGNAGVGYELVKMLYTTGATIYMASRSKVSLYAPLKLHGRYLVPPGLAASLIRPHFPISV